MRQCEFPKCGRGRTRCMCEGDPVTEPARDAHGRTHASLEHTLHTYRKAWEDEKRNRAELEAEVERLRAKAAIVDAMERGEIRVSSSGTHGWSVQAVREGDEAGPSNRWHTAPTLLAAYAVATREGTDA